MWRNNFFFKEFVIFKKIEQFYKLLDFYKLVDYEGESEYYRKGIRVFEEELFLIYEQRENEF